MFGDRYISCLRTSVALSALVVGSSAAAAQASLSPSGSTGQAQPPAVTSQPVSGPVATNTGRIVAPEAQTPAMGQADGTLGDIIVTARKRSETAMQTPVIMQVATEKQLQQFHVEQMEDLGEVVPGLRIQRGFSGSVGMVVTIRGIGSGTSAQYIDQSVGFAVDEVGYSHGSFYDAAAFDLGQVEVLKGPQGLFYGKSTTAGIVSFTTADPTARWESAASASYEFRGDELNLDGHISGPLSDSIGLRVAGYYNTLKGYLFNSNPAGTPAQRRIPDGDSYGGRITLTFADGGPFRAKLKVAGTGSFSHGEQQSMRQFVSCTLGDRPQNPRFSTDNCRLDDSNIGVSAFPAYNPNFDWVRSAGNTAAFASGSPIDTDGSGYLRKRSVLTSLNLAYDLTNDLTLTNVAGFGRVDTSAVQQGAIGTNLYQLYNRWQENDYSNELRLTSGWDDSVVNFMAGGLITRGTTHNVNSVVVPALTRFVEDRATRKSESESLFGQLLITPTPQLEVSAGVRYTHIKQAFPLLSALSNVIGFRPGDAIDASINQSPLLSRAVTENDEHNTSPELTVTYRPNSDVTAFASYKRGYKGPGYNAGNFLVTSYLGANAIVPFGGERVRGGEGGIKARIFNRSTNLTAAVYTYDYLGLQVSHYDGARGIITVSNGADARTRGFELGVSSRPTALRGLELNGFVTYNNGKFTRFKTSPCYGGQTAATGCSPIVTGISVQNLSGRTLPYAPRWTGDIGASYETAVGGFDVAVGASLSFSSRYNYTPALHPRGYQQGWSTLDGYVRLARDDDRWELSLIGRNLTDKRYVATGFDAGAVTAGVLSDTQGISNRPRQVLLQLTVRPRLD